MFDLLFGAASVTLIVGTAFLTDFYSGWYNWQATPRMPASLLVLGWLCLAVLPLLAAWRLNPSSIVPVAVILWWQ